MPYFGLPAPCEAQGYLLVFNETVFIDFIIADQSNVQSITINHLLAQKFPVRLQDERDKFCPVALSKELLSFAAQNGKAAGWARGDTPGTDPRTLPQLCSECVLTNPRQRTDTGGGIFNVMPTKNEPL